MVLLNRQSAAPNVMPMPQNRRRNRTPSHTWSLRHRPFVIQPLCIAPVLAGETMKNMLFQARAVTDPIRNGLIGWWLEYYWFYVKMSDILDEHQMEFLWNSEKPVPTEMLVPETRLELFQVVTGGEVQIDWIGMCYNSIVNNYFRREGEDFALAGSGALARAQRVGNDVWDSAQPAANLATVDVDLTVGTDGKVTASEVEDLMRQYEMARTAGLAPMSFDDYLAQQGVSVPGTYTQAYRPELLRYVRQWQYPTNTVEATTGIPASAVSWAVSERADKDRYFKEPGFIVGVTLARPKIYLASQNGTMSGFVNSAARWMPKQLMDDIGAAIHKVPIASNIADNAAEMMVDLRDLFEHGEYFRNHPDTTAAYYFNQASMIDGDGLGRYPVEADVNNFFRMAAQNNVRQDGVADFTIATQLPTDPLPGVDISV